MRNSPLPFPLPLAFIVALQMLGDFAAVPVVNGLRLHDPAEGIVVCMLFGSLLGQVSLINTYLAWGRDDWIRRWAKSTFLAVLIWSAITAGAISTGDSIELSSIGQFVAIVVGASFLLLSIPYWALRRFSRSRFELVLDNQTFADAAKPQFHLRDLLIWTVGAAIVAGILQSPIGRELSAEDWSISVNELRVVTLWTSLWAAACALVAIPTSWACLARQRRASRLVGLGIYAAILVACEWAVVFLFLSDDPEGILFVAGFNLGILIQVVVTSLLIRGCGYRLRLWFPRRQAA